MADVIGFLIRSVAALAHDVPKVQTQSPDKRLTVNEVEA